MARRHRAAGAFRLEIHPQSQLVPRSQRIIVDWVCRIEGPEIISAPSGGHRRLRIEQIVDHTENLQSVVAAERAQLVSEAQREEGRRADMIVRNAVRELRTVARIVGADLVHIQLPCADMAHRQRRGERIVRISQESIPRSEEHTSELQSLMRISYADFCLKK